MRKKGKKEVARKKVRKPGNKERIILVLDSLKLLYRLAKTYDFFCKAARKYKLDEQSFVNFYDPNLHYAYGNIKTLFLIIETKGRKQRPRRIFNSYMSKLSSLILQYEIPEDVKAVDELIKKALKEYESETSENAFEHYILFYSAELINNLVSIIKNSDEFKKISECASPSRTVKEKLAKKLEEFLGNSKELVELIYKSGNFHLNIGNFPEAGESLEMIERTLTRFGVRIEK